MPSAALLQIPFAFLERIERSQKHSHKAEQHARQLRCHTANTPGRYAVEGYIANAFREQYKAHVEHFLPILLTIESAGAIEAALGIRFGGSEALFVEQYLDRPVEVELAQRGIPHAAIVEIGNLVSTRPGCSQLLFILLAELLGALGRDTAIFTATAQVQQMLGKIGCELIPLCDADGTRLGDHLEQWGSYYAMQPRVVVSDVAANAQLLQRPVLARTLKHHRDDLVQALSMLTPAEPRVVLA